MAKFRCGVAKFGLWRGQVWGVAWPSLGCGVGKFGVWPGLLWDVVWPSWGVAKLRAVSATA
jgi:hypothetical protein